MLQMMWMFDLFYLEKFLCIHILTSPPYPSYIKDGVWEPAVITSPSKIVCENLKYFLFYFCRNSELFYWLVEFEFKHYLLGDEVDIDRLKSKCTKKGQLKDTYYLNATDVISGEYKEGDVDFLSPTYMNVHEIEAI